MEERICESDEF